MRPKRKCCRWSPWLGLALWLSLTTQALGHTGGTVSYGHWQLTDSTAVFSLRVRPADFRSLPAGLIEEDLGTFLLQSTQVYAEDSSCTATATPPQAPEPGWVAWRWHFVCNAAPRYVRLDWLQAMPGHLHLARIGERTDLARGGAAQTLALKVDPLPPAALIGREFQHGLWHIAGGWDHLAFLLGLLLLARGLGALVALVTGFTLGHGAALLLATLGSVLPPSATVEIAIAASILMVGIPDRPRPLAGLALCLPWLAAWWLLPADGWIWAGLLLLSAAHFVYRRHPERHGATGAGLLLATTFGLLHGFGFASAILETAASAHTLWPVLLGFNLGVEAGQLLFLIPAWMLLRRLRQQPWSLSLLQAVICGLGAYWVSERLAGLL